jgi:hypothetical protein
MVSNLILFFLLFLLSCGKPVLQDTRRFKTIAAEFAQYVEFYELQKGSRISRSVGMGFKKLPKSSKWNKQVGLCVEYETGKKEIYIDPDFWYNEASEEQRMSLIFHEFGHCDLGRKHETSLLENGEPRSIMFPKVITWSENEQETYFAELFGR